MFEKINAYYSAKFDELPFPKQFHYASRLWLWSQDHTTDHFLQAAKPTFCGPNPPASLYQVLRTMLDTQEPGFGSKNAAEQRAPYFAKYPLLRQALPLLFRLLFTETIYGINARAELPKIIKRAELQKLADDLLEDEQAIAVLSTHASNFLYLFYRFYLQGEHGFPVARLYEIGKKRYDLSDPIQLQLFIYLYTHCIIGETLFYKRALPSSERPMYIKMADELDRAIAMHYDDVNLDNKFEALVCQRICGRESPLASTIFDEANDSWSKNGNFLVDTHNNNPQSDNITLEKSEHRNVLCLMANRPFTPTGRVIR